MPLSCVILLIKYSISEAVNSKLACLNLKTGEL